MMAIKTIDKPNVHRLVELVRTTLPMIGHVSRVGELVLEKAHQILKRAIRLSNNKEVHLQSVTSAIFNDWQGRMALSVPLLHEVKGVLACARLLGGRNYVAEINGRISPHVRNNVLRAIGPSSCLPSLLRSGAKTVLSPCRDISSCDSFLWTISGNKEELSGEQCSPLLSRNAAVALLRRVVSKETGRTVECGNSVFAALSNGHRILCISQGHIVEVDCYSPFKIAHHHPFVLNRSSVGVLHQSSQKGPLFWAVTAFLRSKSSRKDTSIWAAVLPCRKVSGPAPEYDYGNQFQRFKIGNSLLSLLKIDLTVRRVGVLHDCNLSACAYEQRLNAFVHESGDPLRCTSEFYVLTRDNGYPPRRG